MATEGLADGTIAVKFNGTAGQSFGAFLARGVAFELEGATNDYCGKGLSGGRIVVYPPRDSTLAREKSIIVGNTVLYGAIAGECYFSGVAGERFAVRNSGAIAVVEGAGSHCCEYMTGGVVVVLGETGSNFAAGMSGGVAFVLDERGDFAERCNQAMVDLEPIADEDDALEALEHRSGDLEGHGLVDIAHGMTERDASLLRRLIARHAALTGSPRARIDPRRLGHLSAALRQGHADRVPPRAAADAGARPRDRAAGRERGGRRLIRWAIRPAFSNFSGATAPMRRSRTGSSIGASSPAPLPDDELRRQGARCMDCGTPFCHHACPVNNIIPDWNDLVYQADFKAALATLHQTNNFPDFTGRICPAPCEASCTLNLIEQPVTIKTIEHAIVERGWAEGWIEPQVAAHHSGKRVAVIGSGPAGLACAQQLARAGHAVVGIREVRAHRRPVALWHSRLQAREIHHRPAHRADARRRRRVPSQQPCRRHAFRSNG